MPEPGFAHDPVVERQLAVRAGADAQVVAELPVVQVVPAGMAFAAVGRDLVVPQPRGAGFVLDQRLHVGGQVVVGQGRRSRCKQRVRLERQVVIRQVRRLEGQRLAQVGAQCRQRLARQRVHQVDVVGLESVGRRLDRASRLVRIVDAPDCRQRIVGETLHADRQPSDARLRVGPKARRLEGAGIGLHRDLGARGQPEPRANHRQQPLDRIGREQARRAAADEHRLHRAAPDQRQRRLEIGLQRAEVAGLGDRLRVAEHFVRVAEHFVRIKVAVRALAHAPWQVHVQRQRRRARHAGCIAAQQRQPRQASAVAAAAGRARRPDRNHADASRASRSRSTSARIACPRWLSRFFVSASSSATVRPSSGIRKCGS